MKRMILIGIILSALLLSASGKDRRIGLVGETDGSVNVDRNNHYKNNAITEKDPVRMVKIEGSLYYETDEDSELAVRREGMDGSFQKGAERFEIPKNDGEANFSEAKGYQIGMEENTIEIPIGDDWEIFKKIDVPNTDPAAFQYCMKLEGASQHMPREHEYVILTNQKEITIEDADQFYTGSMPDKDICIVAFKND